MNTDSIMDLRKRLAKNLKRLIGNPTIEAKELAAFDLIMSRRQFLKSTQLAAIGALVASALPPTAWGKMSDACHHVKPDDVGLTPAEMAAVTQASGIDFGTELFQDTIYAESVVAKDQPNIHALIEGPRSRMRVQSQLDDRTPLEENFLDSGFHFGPSELVQIEQNGNEWELVHYFHPWNARTDGARTDGLIRHVIQGQGFRYPTKVLCITGSHTNEFITTSQGQQVAAAYLIYVEQENGSNHGFIFMGRALASIVSGRVADLVDYPLEWTVQTTANLGVTGATANYKFADKYVNAGLDLAVPGDFVPAQATEHIIIYAKGKAQVLSLDDATTPGTPNLLVTTAHYPSGVSDARIAHIEFNPIAPGAGEFLQLSDYALVSTDTDSSGPYNINMYSNQSRNATIVDGGYKDFNSVSDLKWLEVTYSNSAYARFTRAFSATPEEDDRPDYQTLRNVNGLASTVVTEPSGSTFTETVHLKIGNFPGTTSTNNRGLCLFALDRLLGDDFGVDPDLVRYELWGDYPLKVPDDAGIGKITGISGGVSKFGGLRLFASDNIGNLFMLRQQRLNDSTTPYAPPIYIQNDAQGNPATFSTSQPMALPPSTATASNLQDYDQWMTDFYGGFGTVSNQPSAGVVAYNFLLSGALGFGSDDTNVTQATWLGSGYQAVYAPNRFAHDAEHMVVREVTDDGTNVQFNVSNVFNNIVEKTWVSRLIACQVEPAAPGMQERGDFYQVTIYATNIYGNQVALNDTTNPGLMIEIRGDAPATVIDLTNNFFYDVDRYTSFVALPDPASNELRVAVKAENFSQILYVRLLQTDELSTSFSDSAMLDAGTSSVGTATDWVAINIAANGQARMAASSATTGATSGTCGNGCEDAVYICTESLCQSNADNNWQTKGGYSPGSSNLNSLSQYLNQSGQNLADASANAANFALGAAQVDPLTSTTPLTADNSRTRLTTTFDYKGGAITVETGDALSAGLPGSVTSSLNHALHDSLHWLQHVEGSLYGSLANGVSVVIDGTVDITVTVSRDIQKQVNGLDEDLTQVVSTVEEYGSIVVNVVVTIVESSFIYKFIELLIALISLFIYLEDIKHLSNSLKSLIRDLPDANSPYPWLVDADYPWEEKLTGYVGSPNNVDNDMNQATTDAVVDAVVDGLLNTVLKNPLTRKLLDEIVSALSRAISNLETSSPVQFNVDPGIVNTQIQLFEDFSNDVESLYVNVTDDAVNFLINQVIDDVENPQQTYTNFASGLGQFMAQVDADAMDAVYNALGELVATDTSLIDEVMNQSDFLELDIPLLADLFQLFGIGSASGNKVTLGSGDAISFPLAVIIWLAIFEATGKSINNINDLIPAPAGSPGDPLPGATTDDKLAFANAVVAADLMTVNGIIWTALQTATNADRNTATFKNLNLAGDWAILMRWFMAGATWAIQRGTGQASTAWTNDYLPVFTYCRFVTAVTSLSIKYSSTTISPRAMPGINSFFNLAAIAASIIDAAAVSSDQPKDSDWALLVGNDVGRAGVFGKLLYAIFYGDSPPEGADSLPWYSLYVTGTAFAGFGAAAAATGVEKKVGTGSPGDDCRQSSPRAIKQLIRQVDALIIRLPQKAKCKQKIRLTGYLQQALRAYAQGDIQKAAKYLVRAGRKFESLKRGRRIAAAEADLLITQILDILACQGV